MTARRWRSTPTEDGGGDATFGTRRTVAAPIVPGPYQPRVRQKIGGGVLPRCPVPAFPRLSTVAWPDSAERLVAAWEELRPIARSARYGEEDA